MLKNNNVPKYWQISYYIQFSKDLIIIPMYSCQNILYSKETNSYISI